MIVVLFSLTHRQRSYVHEKNMLGMLRLVWISPGLSGPRAANFVSQAEPSSR